MFSVSGAESDGNPLVYILEPYYGGSHRAFLDNLAKRLPFRFKFLTMPARKWKWRMRLAAPVFADLLQSMAPADMLFCSTFVDVAVLRGLAPAWAKDISILTYFHENQFAYPVQAEAERDFHFSLTNYTTALASDGLAFNSRYNLETFLDGIRRLVKKADDMSIKVVEAAIRKKSVILPPGLDFHDFPPPETIRNTDEPIIVWNHRWEHDKNPELFFNTLYRLDSEAVPFKLVVLGQAFKRRPPIFEEARKRLAHRILHFGFAKSRQEYIRWLQKSDVVVSTAGHEFFGMAVVEAVRAGCRPLLPNRLAYPELFPAEFLYDDDELYPALLKILVQEPVPLGAAKVYELTEAHSWNSLAPQYLKWLGAFLGD